MSAYGGHHEPTGDPATDTIDALVRERDEAEAEVKRLRQECEDLRAELERANAWIIPRLSRENMAEKAEGPDWPPDLPPPIAS